MKISPFFRMRCIFGFWFFTLVIVWWLETYLLSFKAFIKLLFAFSACSPITHRYRKSIDFRPRWRTTSNSVCAGTISTQICRLGSTSHYVAAIWWTFPLRPRGRSWRPTDWFYRCARPSSGKCSPKCPPTPMPSVSFKNYQSCPQLDFYCPTCFSSIFE